jgi:uncharacterized protein
MKTRLCILFTALCFMATAALADGAADVRRRMEQRLPAIDDLKAKEVIGENNRGFVEIHQNGTTDAGRLVAEENSDREAVYALIAQQTGASSDSVGRARARQIASNSRSGVWLQDERGNWYKKK